MKNKLRWLTTIMLLVAVMVVSVGHVEAKQTKPAKLGKSDFVFTAKGKKVDFIKFGKDNDWAYYVYASLKEGEDCKASIKDFTTKRNVKDGSSMAYVKKKYGSQKKKKIKSTTGFYKGVKYDEPQLDISSWKSYLSYNYKKGSDKYEIIFCFNKKNKVAGILYLKNESKLYNYPNKQLETGITFKAPEGKKVTTKKIGGKKVYMLPKGTTVYYDEKKSNCEAWLCDCRYAQYSVKGEIKARSDVDGRPTSKLEDRIKSMCYLWDSEKDTPKYKNKELQKINMKKLGKYRYFTLTLFKVNYMENNEEFAPQVIYFKFV